MSVKELQRNSRAVRFRHENVLNWMILERVMPVFVTWIDARKISNKKGTATASFFVCVTNMYK